MGLNPLSLSRFGWRGSRLAAGLFVITAAAAVTPACGSKPRSTNNDDDDEDNETPVGSLFRLDQTGSVERIDLLLAIDNSRSMADKQEMLALSVTDLVWGLANPLCIDEYGVPAAGQPGGPLEACPPGAKRSFAPVTDIHIGVISSSLGGHGGNACPDQENNTCAPGVNFSNNDKGHLLTRKEVCDDATLPTYQDKGFLAWDPMQKLTPPGEGDLRTDTNGDDRALVPDLRDLVIGVGQFGCGYESQLESWYRFLVDPEPHETISVVNGAATPQGIDNVLLQQRADFLRPDSLLSVVMLTDENDCSIKESGQFYLAAQIKNGNGTAFHLPRARSECASNPNDPCCKSCGQPAGDCPADPTCTDANGAVKALTDLEDPANLRCYDQKRRFGIDFLYPTDRYTQALTSLQVPNRKGELVPNPLFTDLNPADAITGVRDPGHVFFAAIAGVPWQDIARDPSDLAKGFKLSAELAEPTAGAQSVWDVILGDPAQYVPPMDPYMIESIYPRTGTNPITGDAIAQPGSPNGSSPINGHEYSPPFPDDLQYACIFPLVEPRYCGSPGILSCDCTDPGNDSPLCEEDPANPGSRTLQVAAKAYPGLRQLQVLKSLGSQGILTSVCPQEVVDPNTVNFVYRPALTSIIEGMRDGLADRCLERTLPVTSNGQASCITLEALQVDPANVEACNACAEPGRMPVTGENQDLVAKIGEDPLAPTAKWNCFCQIPQTTGADLAACQNDLSGMPVNAETNEVVNGWCYVDPSASPPLGNPAIVSSCRDTERRIVRFVGESEAKPGATLFMSCAE